MTPHQPPILAKTERFFNKELSWLEFNARVLEEALNEKTFLLERLKFLSIFSSNLDEFFMVRVAGLKKMEQEALRYSDSPDEMETSQVLHHIRQRTLFLLEKQAECYRERVVPELEKHRIKILPWSELGAKQLDELHQFFESEVSPVLTPLGVDPAHPFPFLSNQSLYIVVAPHHGAPSIGEIGLGFVEVPSILPRLISVSPTEPHFILLEDLIKAKVQNLFFGVQKASTYTIRVVRNLDYNLLENKVVDLLKSIQKEMINREHQEVVRLEVEEGLPDPIKDILIKHLLITPFDCYELSTPLHLPGLMSLYRVPLEELKDPPFNPRLPQVLAGHDDIFSVIARQDLMVHHPYESFYAVSEFLSSAAHDPSVLAIKITLYRSAGDSPIIDALITAAENGKQVTAVIELKARFDERNNITWARRLERSGVNVVFGCVGLKTHCKVALVVRKEGSKLVRYVHLSTGNYNSNTAKLYTDIGTFTTNDAIGRDIAHLFNMITGFDVLTGVGRFREDDIAGKFTHIFVAPINLRDNIIRLIEEEVQEHLKTGEGYILCKMNALVDEKIIDTLYKASQKGVRIHLIVRGICCLRPKIPGLSENIEVISILDRFLEHSRLFYFHANGEQKLFVSSADWMPRNMDRRIEIMWPIHQQDVKSRIINEILKNYWADNVKARVLEPDGTYSLRKTEGEPHRAQEKLIAYARQGGVQSVPYEVAIKHHPTRKNQKPVARRKSKKLET